jgi:hypothetical protein
LELPVALPEGMRVTVHVASRSEPAESALNWLAEHAVDDDACPTDLAHQHDHYLYGAPKKTS